MESISGLCSELTRLEGLAAEIKKQGMAIKNPSFWFDSAKNKAKVTYYRKRWFDENGRKRSEIISPEKMRALKQAIARGQELNRVEKQIRQVTTKLAQSLEIAAALGLSPSTE